MDTGTAGAETIMLEEETSDKAGSTPPPIILTSTVKLVQLQKQLKNVVKGDFEFRNNKNETRVLTKSMADF
jgi:hypothetical protein